MGFVLAMLVHTPAFSSSAPTLELFRAYCAACHMPDAEGVPGLYPPLDEAASMSRTPDGRAYLARVVLFGLIGRIEVGGRVYGERVYMPAFHRYLDDDTLADLLNELLAFEERQGRIGGFAPYTAEEIARHRSREVTPNAMLAERSQALRSLRGGER